MGAYSYYGRREYKNIWDSHIYHFKSLVVRFGVGLIYSEKVDSGTHIYGGARIGINANYVTPVYYSDKTESREQDYYVTPCVGGEYLLSQHFGLGGEAQLQFTFFGNPSYSNKPYDYPVSDTKTVFKTNALIFVRWYFQ